LRPNAGMPSALPSFAAERGDALSLTLILRPNAGMPSALPSFCGRARGCPQPYPHFCGRTRGCPQPYPHFAAERGDALSLTQICGWMRGSRGKILRRSRLVLEARHCRRPDRDTHNRR
jgi:hypothetical protein